MAHGYGATIDIVVYDVAVLEANWTPDECDGRFATWQQFRDSTMFPFTNSAMGEVGCGVLLDPDVDTLVVLINEPERETKE